MLYEGVGKTLGQVLPKFPPTTDKEVDSLLAINIRVYVLVLLIVLILLRKMLKNINYLFDLLYL